MDRTSVISVQQVCYCKEHNTYGICFKSVTEMVKTFSKQRLLHPVLLSYRKKGYKDISISQSERILVPLTFSSSNLMIKVSADDLLSTASTSCHPIAELPLDGCPAMVNDEIGLIFEDFMQFLFAFAGLFEDLNHDDDCEFEKLEGTYHFFSLTRLLKDGAIELTRVPFAEIRVLSHEYHDHQHQHQPMPRAMPPALEPLATAVKDRMDRSFDSIGHTTVASSGSTSSSMSYDSTPITYEDSPDVTSSSVTHTINVITSSSSSIPHHRKKKSPLNAAMPSNEQEIFDLARDLHKYGMARFLDALLHDGWVSEEAAWSDAWWSCELIYIPPWNAAAGETSRASWKCGCDYFWCLEDIATYIRQYGFPTANHHKHILPSSEFLHDFSDPAWNIDRRIISIVKEGSSRMERDRLPVLLTKTGWKCLSRESKRKGRNINQEKLYIPSWNADPIDWDTTIHYTLNVDFFTEIDELVKHLNRFGNVPAVTRSSPSVKLTSSPSSSSSFTSSASPNNVELRDQITKLSRNGAKFSEIWPRLQEIGWKNLYTDSASWHIGSSVYVPAWEAARLNEVATNSYPAIYKVNKRDYFSSGEDIIAYINKHGLIESKTAVTPTETMRRVSKPVQREVYDKVVAKPPAAVASQPPSKKMEPTSSTVTQLTNTKGAATSKQAAAVDKDDDYENMSISSEYSVADNIMRILTWNPAKKYLFPPLWKYLKEYGWKSVWQGQQQLFIPDWTGDLPDKVKQSDLCDLVSGLDYFDDKEKVMDYLKKHGLKRVQALEVDDNDDHRTRHVRLVKVEQKQPPAKEVAAKKSSTKHSSKTTKGSSDSDKQKKLPATAKTLSSSSQLSAEDRVLQDILHIDRSKFYVFPKLWEYLQTRGWKCMQTNNKHLDLAYVANWAIHATPVKAYRFNLAGAVAKVDYFVDTKDVVDYVSKHGLHRVVDAIEDDTGNDEQEDQVDGDHDEDSSHHAMMVDDVISSSKKKRKSSFSSQHEAYSIRVINPKRPVRGQEDRDSDPYDALNMIEADGSPLLSSPQSSSYTELSAYNDHLMDIEDVVEAEVELDTSLLSSFLFSPSNADRPACWQGLSQYDVVSHAVAFLDNGMHSKFLLGRDKEFHEVLTMVESARLSGHGRNILLHGQPGQGKSHIVKAVVSYYTGMINKAADDSADLASMDVVLVQGNAAYNNNDVFSAIYAALGLNHNNNMALKEAVLHRFQSTTMTTPDRTDHHSSSGRRGRPGKKPRAMKKVPLTLLVVEEAYQANVDDMRAIMEVACSDTSSVVVLGVFNNRAFYDSLRMDEDAYDNIDVKVYSSEDLEQIVHYYLSGLADEAAIRMLAMNCMRNDFSDVRSLTATCSRCLQDFKEQCIREENTQSYDGNAIITLPFVRKTINMLNSTIPTQQSHTMQNLDSINIRLLVAMFVASIGLHAHVIVADVKAAYEAYCAQLHIDVQLMGDSIEQRLEALADQRLLSKAGSKAKKSYKLEIKKEDLMTAIEHNSPICYRSLKEARDMMADNLDQAM